MSQVEICLLFKKGRIPKPRGKRNIRQFISSCREKHSKKPDEIRDRIVEMFPSQSKIELFARDTYEGWDKWGDEVIEMRVSQFLFSRELSKIAVFMRRKL